MGMAVVIPDLKSRGFCLTSQCEPNGLKAIYIASSRGHVDVVKTLLQCGVSTAEIDDDDRTALHHAVLSRRLSVVRFLVSLESAAADVNRGDGRGWNPLHSSCHEGLPDAAELLLRSGVSVNCRTKMSLCTPLHFAAKSGHLQCADSLLKGGASVDRSDGRGYTSLHYAAKVGHAEMVKFLIKAKASVLSTTKRLNSQALHLAAMKGNLECIVALVRGGALVDCKDVDHWTPLHCAICNGHKYCAKFLVEHEANVHCRTAHRQLCPLHLAAQEGNLSCLQYLISVGADPKSVDIGGSTALHKAVKEGKVDCVVYLLSMTKDTMRLQTKKHGRQPLHVAAAFGHVEVVKVLVKSGADLTVRDDDGRSPLDLAKTNGHMKSVKYISDYLSGCKAAAHTRSGQEASNISGISSDDTTARAKAMMSISEDSDNRREVDECNYWHVGDKREQPEGKQNEPISDKSHVKVEQMSAIDLREIAQYLGSSWKMVGRRLGLIDAQLQNIQADYRESQLEQGYQMLIKWKSQIDQKHGNPNTSLARDTLNQALVKTGIRLKSVQTLF